MPKCQKCGAEVSETSTVCPKCFSFINFQKKEEQKINYNNDKIK